MLIGESISFMASRDLGSRNLWHRTPPKISDHYLQIKKVYAGPFFFFQISCALDGTVGVKTKRSIGYNTSISWTTKHGLL